MIIIIVDDFGEVMSSDANTWDDFLGFKYVIRELIHLSAQRFLILMNFVVTITFELSKTNNKGISNTSDLFRKSFF
jgi:hypothetical protein